MALSLSSSDGIEKPLAHPGLNAEPRYRFRHTIGRSLAPSPPPTGTVPATEQTSTALRLRLSAAADEATPARRPLPRFIIEVMGGESFVVKWPADLTRALDAGQHDRLVDWLQAASETEPRHFAPGPGLHRAVYAVSALHKRSGEPAVVRTLNVELEMRRDEEGGFTAQRLRLATSKIDVALPSSAVAFDVPGLPASALLPDALASDGEWMDLLRPSASSAEQNGAGARIVGERAIQVWWPVDGRPGHHVVLALKPMPLLGGWKVATAEII